MPEREQRQRGAVVVNISSGRRAWLEKLAREGIAHRPKGRVGYDCMRAGLTEWAWLSSSGEIFSTDELVAMSRRGQNPVEQLSDHR